VADVVAAVPAGQARFNPAANTSPMFCFRQDGLLVSTLEIWKKYMAITGVMDRDQVAEAYGRWAPIYDIVFGPVFRQGRRAAVRAAEGIGGRILEVGVGTGLSLADYGNGTRVVGIDISKPMLDKARKRIETQHLSHVEALEVMDAEHLAVPDASFDVVVAQYVVTAIPHPEQALNEFVRVVRPGGEIILTTRIGAETGLRGMLEKWLMPLTTRLGFRTEFPWARYERWAEGSKAVRLLERRALPPLGHFWLLRYVRLADPVGAPP
jgi:phosphatidylethanolamine/phosphatidyl-N-methylethanolamine N-methyltransferase